MKPLLGLFLVTVTSVQQLSACPKIVSKSEWGGRAASNIDYTIKPVKYVIVHHTDTPTCTTQSDCSRRLVNMQSYHMDDLDFQDIGYNFIVGGDGQVYEGAGWHKVGAHTKSWNTKSLGIGFMGSFNTKAPNAKQLDAGKQFIKCAVDLGEIASDYKLIGAKTVRDTDSPGAAFFNVIKKWRGFTENP